MAEQPVALGGRKGTTLLNPQRLGDQVGVKVGIAESRFLGLGPSCIKLQIVLPGETHCSMA